MDPIGLFTPTPDPFPPQHALRERGGVEQVDDRFWFVAPHTLVQQGFAEASCFSSRSMSGAASDSLLHMDGDEHRRVRRLIGRGFAPRAMHGTEGVVRAIAEQLIGDLPRDGRADLVQGLTIPLPAVVFCAILGIPHENRSSFLKWSDEAVEHSYRPEPPPSEGEFRAYIGEQIERARREPGTTLLHHLIDESDGQGRLSTNELVAAIRILIIAGNETTANLLATLFHQLLVDPSRFEQVRQDRSLVNRVVEEALRYDPPLNWVPRVAAAECPLGEQTIPEGHRVALGVGIANRDPDVFDEPDEFRLDRVGIHAKHLTFGYGEHYCLGAGLARIEGRTTLETVLDLLPDLALEPGYEYAPKGPVMMRGADQLPVTYTHPETAP
jgi:cytochrome P450